MKNIIELIEADVVHEKFEDIEALARARNEEWDLVDRRRNQAEEKLKAMDPKTLLEYERALNELLTMEIRAAYMMGLADGIQLKNLPQELQENKGGF